MACPCANDTNNKCSCGGNCQNCTCKSNTKECSCSSDPCTCGPDCKCSKAH